MKKHALTKHALTKHALTKHALTKHARVWLFIAMTLLAIAPWDAAMAQRRGGPGGGNGRASGNNINRTQVHAAGPRNRASADTVMVVRNNSAQPVTVYLTLGSVAGCVQNIHNIPFITNFINGNNKQGYFTLNSGQQISYEPRGSERGFNGNFAFGTGPNNCPSPPFPNGVSLFEFILNNDFQGQFAQETVDISDVDGVNARMQVAFAGGGNWNAGSSQPNVTQIQNVSLLGDIGQIGVFPYQCDICTARQAPPSCPEPKPAFGGCQSANTCNVQRDATNAGGTVTLTYLGIQ